MRSTNRSPPPPYSPYPQPALHGCCDAHGVRCQCGQARVTPFEPMQLQHEDPSHYFYSHSMADQPLLQPHSMADQPLLQPPPSSGWSVDNFSHVYSPVAGESTTNLTDDQLARGCGYQVQHQSQINASNFNQGGGALNNQARWYRKYCNHQVPAVVVFGVVAAVFSVTYLYMVVVYRLQPSPIVDEAFHIPQAQKYCQGKFNEWDPKLTTLPGLYLFSIGITGPISWIFGGSLQKRGTADRDDPGVLNPSLPESLAGDVKGVDDDAKGMMVDGDGKGVMGEGGDEGVCSVLMLRLVNVVVAPCTLLALHSLMCFMHGIQCSEWSCLAASVSLVLLPPLFWFYSLYYTEPLSTMLVLLMLLLYCHGNHGMAAAIGAVSILARQTNVVWVLFLLLLRGVDCALRLLSPPSAPPLRTLHSLHHCKVLWRRLRRLAQDGGGAALKFVCHVALACAPYLVLLAAFAAFVWANGGLVVGDRSAHEATLHLMQVYYFCLFYLLFSPVLAFNNIQNFISLCCKHPKRTCLLLVVTLSVAHQNTLVHPYLLADNRHYTFYLWNRFYARHVYFRYLMAPVYLYGGHLVWNVSLERRSNVFRLVYAVCVALCVVPQRLLEPRYFILPFLIARVQKSPNFGGEAERSPARAPESRGNPARALESRGNPARAPESRGNPARALESRGNPARCDGSRGSHGRCENFRGNPGRCEGSRGNPGRCENSRGNPGRCDNFRGNTARSAARSGGGNPARASTSRTNHVRGAFRYVHTCVTYTCTLWKHVRVHVSRYVPAAHIGWEFMYYLAVNLATLAVFATKTFWWKDFAEPQRIMW